MKKLLLVCMALLLYVTSYSQNSAKINLFGYTEIDAVKEVSKNKKFKFFSRKEDKDGSVNLFYNVDLSATATVTIVYCFDKAGKCYMMSELYPIQYFEHAVKNMDQNPLYTRGKESMTWIDESTFTKIKVSTTDLYCELNYTPVK